MKKTFLIVSLSSLIFAQSNNISDNSFTGNRDIYISQSNTISKEQIEIDKKIDNEILNLSKSNYDNSTKNFLNSLYQESKKINKEQIPKSEKNRKCNFKIEMGINLGVFKLAHLKLGISKCNTFF